MQSTRTISYWRGSLPHWEVIDARYFVTLRLAGSLPRHVEAELEDTLRATQEADCLTRSRAYFLKLERWLDADKGSRTLADAAVAHAIASTISKYEELRFWTVPAFSVMPNHMHLLFSCCSLGMSAIMRRFKQRTARDANALTNRRAIPFWQCEWFDHWSRSPMEDEKIASYIRNNPVRAGLPARYSAWPWMRVRP